MSTERADKALSKAKISLMAKADTAFFVTVCFSLRHEWCEDIQTACTNGQRIQYNPDFFLSLSEEERVFLILHETMHVVFMHILRLKEHELRRWNYAGDYVINDLLIQRGFKMPKDGLHDEKYRDMTTEQVYELLDPESIDSDFEVDMESPDGDITEAKNEIDDILVRASIQSQISQDKVGTIPGEVQLYLDRLLDPVLPWNQILARFMNRMVKNDYTFQKPNRRFFPDVILPTQYSTGLDDIAIAIDTSGSITDEQFMRFVSETYAILKYHKPGKITFIQFDTRIRSINELHSPQDLTRLEFTGRGGTRIDEVIDWTRENKPNVLLMFTDGYFPNSNPDPKIPIIWLIHTQQGYKAPYGKVIDYNI